MAAGGSVHHIFQWDGGGKEVFLVGSFNGWEKVPVTLPNGSGGVCVDMELPVGTHHYMFIVDRQWTLDPSNPLPVTNTGHNQVILNDGFQFEGDPNLAFPDADSETDSDYDSSVSDTESIVSHTSSQPGGEATTKLNLTFPQAAKNRVKQHIESLGYKENIVTFRTSRKGCSAVVTMAPSSIGWNAIATLNDSLVDGKHKLTVRTRRRGKQGASKKTVKDGDVKTNPSKSGSCRVYVGSKLPEYTNEQHIKDHFHKFAARIENVELIRDRRTNQFKGFGFILFSSPACAQAAVRDLNQSTLLGVRIRVAPDNSSTPLPPVNPSMADPDDESDTESVSSNLSDYADKFKVIVHSHPKFPNVSNKVFRNHFREFQSSISKAFVVRHRKTKHSLGFGLVFFTSLDAAQLAVERMRNTAINTSAGPCTLISLSIKNKGAKFAPTEPSIPSVEGVRLSEHSPVKPHPPPLFDQPLSQPPPFQQLPSQQPLSQQLSSSVIVDNVDTSLGESEIRSLINVPMLSFSRQSPKSILIKLYSSADAQTAVQTLNGKSILGETFQAHVQPEAALFYGRSQSVPNQPPATSGYVPPPTSQGYPPPTMQGYPQNPHAGHPAPPLQAEFSRGPSVSSHPPYGQNTGPGGHLGHFGPPSQQGPPGSHGPPVQHGPPGQYRPPGSPPPGQLGPHGQHISPGHAVPPGPYGYSRTPGPSGPPGQNSNPGYGPPVHDNQLKSPGLPTSTDPPGSTSVKVTHLPPGVTKELLYMHFRKAGEIDGDPVIHVGPKSIYAHINFYDPLAAQRAVTLFQGSQINGVGITVKLQAAPKPKIDRENHEKIMQLSDEQWNYLMHMSGGTCLFSEIIVPYNSNPNIVITPVDLEWRIKFAGKFEVVESAYDFVKKNLKKEIVLDSKFQKEALRHLKSTLPNELQQKYSVSIPDFLSSSTTLKFEGPSAGVEKAYDEVHRLVQTLQSKEVQVPRQYEVSQLESSRAQVNHLVYICCSDTTPRMSAFLYSFDAALLEHTAPVVQQLLSVNSVPLECKPEEVVYLKRFNKAILSKLPAKVSFDGKEKATLCGGEGDIQTTLSRIKSEILFDLSSRRFTFTCNTKFQSQIEQCLLTPRLAEEQTFKYLIPKLPSQGKSAHGKGRRKSSQAQTEVNDAWSVYIFCKNAHFFEDTCHLMQRLNPGSKFIPISHKDEEKIVREMKGQLENKYQLEISVNDKSTSYMIHGLFQDEIQKCHDEIKARMDETIVDAKYVPVDLQLYKVLKLYQNEMMELRRSCVELTVLPPRKDHDSTLIRIKGSISQVNDVKERLSSGLLSMSVTSEQFSISCPQYQFGMWCRRWNQIREQEAKRSKVIIEFTKAADSADSKKLSVHFDVVGTDKDSVQDVMGAIVSEGTETEEKTLSLSANSISCLYEAKRDKKLDFLSNHIVFIGDINKKNHTVSLLTPKELSDTLDEAEELIRKFTGEQAKTSHVISSKDPVVGLILSSNTRSLPYIAMANNLAKTHGAVVKVLKKPSVGLRISGTESTISVVKPILHLAVIEAIEKTVGRKIMPVKSLYKSFLSTSDFSRFQSKLENELCVICSLPKVGKASKLVSSSLLQLPMSNSYVKVDVCKGDLVQEQVEAIVNAANEDLKHIGGLAKAILDAGGPTIQSESDEYTRANGKVKPGKAVCLGAGDLPCKKVVHAVGPRWSNGLHGEEQLLYFAVYESLIAASKESLTSIAFPAIGTGIFGVPEGICARASLKAVRDFVQSTPFTTIQTVKFILYSKDTVNAFKPLLVSGLCGEYQGGHASHPLASRIAALASATPSPHVSNWQWYNDQGSFSYYSSNLSAKLTSAFQQNPKGTFQLTINGVLYTIDFAKMLQINPNTGFSRPIAQVAEQPNVQWMYKDDEGVFMPYSSADSNTIESMYQNNLAQNLVINGKMYTIDFKQMCQINVSTQFKRSIQRRVTSPASPTGIVPDLSGEDLVITLRGPLENLPAAEARITSKLEGAMKKQVIEALPKNMSADLEKKIHHIAKKNEVECCFEKKQKRRVLKIEGVFFKVQAAVSAIQEEILTFIVNSVSSSEPNSESEKFLQDIRESVKNNETVNRQLAHSMLVGPNGSGKSSLMDRLLQRPRKAVSLSTGVCSAVVMVDIDIYNPSTFRSVNMTDSNTWEVVGYNASLVRQMNKDVLASPHEHVQLVSASPPTEITSPPTEITSPPTEMVNPPTEMVSPPTEMVSPPTDISVPISAPREQAMQTETVTAKPVTVTASPPAIGLSNSKLLLEALDRCGGYENFRKSYRGASLYLRDAGGQVEFQEMISLLVSGPSIFLFVFRTDLDFQSKFSIEYRASKSESINCYISSITIEEALLQCLASVYAMDTQGMDGVKTRKPLVLIIGTHKDRLGVSADKKITELNKHLDSLIQRNGFEDLVQYADTRQNQVMFAVDNTSEGDEDFKAIRSTIHCLISNRKEFTIEYPIVYLLFCLELQTLEQSVLCLKEFKEMAAKYGIVDNEVSDLLQFLHLRIGVIQYYDIDDLRHIVVNKPQVLFDKVTNLIIRTFSSDALSTKEQRNFQKGILLASAIKSIVSNDDQFTSDDFLKLLIHLRIITPYPSTTPDDQEEKYFMPCVLNHVKKSNDEGQCTDILPLSVRFQCLHCPKGLFGVLVARLMTIKPTEETDISFALIEHKIIKDQVSFVVHSNSYHDELSLRILPSHIEIKCFPTLDEERVLLSVGEVCSNIRQVIETSILRSVEDLHYNKHKVEPVMCLKCENCSELHQVKKGDCCKMHCEKIRKDICIPLRGRCWYNEVSESATTSPTSPHVGPAEPDNGGSDLTFPSSISSSHHRPHESPLPTSTCSHLDPSGSANAHHHLDPTVSPFPISKRSRLESLPASARLHLDQQLEWNDLIEIARYMLDWEENLCNYLGLIDVDIHDIKVKNQNNPILQRREALGVWKKRQGPNATYRNLLELFENVGHSRCAEKVHEILNEKQIVRKKAIPCSGFIPSKLYILMALAVVIVAIVVGFLVL